MRFVDLRWLDAQDPDEGDLAGAVGVLEAARQADYPHEPLLTTTSFTAEIRHGWDGDAPLVAVHRDDGRVTGVLAVYLPQHDNRHVGYLEITVDPLCRRRGLGRALFDAAVQRVRDEGRTVVMIGAFDGAQSHGFATAIGVERASADVKRRQHLWRLDAARLDKEYAAAEAAAGDYELFRMPQVIPDDMMPAVVELVSAINDAPIDDLDLEDEVFSAERLRAFAASQRAHRRRTHQLVARHCASGVLAGHTMVAVEAEQPWYSHQFDTSVLAAHRGHRLGLLLKIGMLRWLAEDEPQLRVLDTWNAASNDHMIAVNEAIGYEVVATAAEYQAHL
jgi:GNAT superfamily N-acetyltransferase